LTPNYNGLFLFIKQVSCSKRNKYVNLEIGTAILTTCVLLGRNYRYPINRSYYLEFCCVSGSDNPWTARSAGFTTGD